MEEKEHVLSVLKQVKKALKEKNYVEIKSLSNKIIHISSIHQEADIISLAVIIYSLSKLIEREDYKNEKNWDKFYQNYIQNIDDMIYALKNEDLNRFHQEIQSNRKLIQGLSGHLKKYIQDVFQGAKINKASRIYEHGISMEKTASILGVSLWELAEYTGKTQINNVNLGLTIPIKERIKFAEEIFK
jgi:hypothetical protein